jgi:hypothetical protein
MRRFLTTTAVIVATLALMFFFIGRLESNIDRVVSPGARASDVDTDARQWNPVTAFPPALTALVEQLRTTVGTWAASGNPDHDHPDAAGQEENGDTTTRKPMVPAL